MKHSRVDPLVSSRIMRRIIVVSEHGNLHGKHRSIMIHALVKLAARTINIKHKFAFIYAGTIAQFRVERA